VGGHIMNRIVDGVIGKVKCERLKVKSKKFVVLM
jgi:hypothetical protein